LAAEPPALPPGPGSTAASTGQAQRLLATTLASIDAGLVATDRMGRVTALNEVGERVLGWTEAEALGCSYWDVFARQGRPATYLDTNPVDLMLQQGISVRDQQHITVIARSGKLTPLRANATLTHAADGSPSGMLMVFRDLTHQTEAETQNQLAQQRFRLVVEAAPNGFVLVNSQGVVTLANRKAEALFGYASGGLTGLPVEVLVPPRARATHETDRANMARQAVHGQTRDMRGVRDVVGLRQDGTEVPIDVGLSTIDMPDGRFTLASIIDITDRKQRDDELRRSNADLEQFAYIASHDLQEPLRMVASYTELLAQRYQGQLDERADKYIFYAVDGARRMQQLVADLLAFARVGSQGKPLAPVDSGAVLAKVLHVLAPRISAAGAAVLVSALPWVLADEGQLHQLLLNLLGNALKFRSEEAPLIMVKAERSGAHDPWTFAVQDNGIGIEPQYAERIFQMFQRLHERGKYDGSGIGLAIARRILERHGGRIWLRSAPGTGSSFFFTLPGLPAAATPVAAETPTAPV
jgi:PAS domain S-box-containing protein